MEYLFIIYYIIFFFFLPKIIFLLDFIWDNSINVNNITSDIFITFFNTKVTIFFEKFNLHSIFLSLDNFLLILFIYTFYKNILISSIFELIWPTQIFNKKNNINFTSLKKKSFIEFFLKIKEYNKFIFLINLFFFKNFKF